MSTREARLLASVGLLVALLAACGAPPPSALAPGSRTALSAAQVGHGGFWLTPDLQKTLARGPQGQIAGSWYDLKGVADGQNLDARDLDGLAGGDGAFYAYLTGGQGPVDVYVGGLSDEAQPWLDAPIPCLGGAPALALDYALDPYCGPGKRFWWPLDHRWRTSLLPCDGIPGVANLSTTVAYGAYLLDRVISKLEAAGASEVRVYGHSKGAYVCGTALHDPQGRYDRLHDTRVAPMWTFAMPFVAPFSPRQWAGHSAAAHWGGLWRTEGGHLLIYNRDSDFVTFGGWVDMDSHDYSHLVQDSWLGPYAGNRGSSPPWSPTENFMARYRAFAAATADRDQSPETLSYDW